MCLYRILIIFKKTRGNERKSREDWKGDEIIMNIMKERFCEERQK